METMYLVGYYRHNKSTGGSAYKTEFASESKDAALKKFYALAGEYIDGGTYDHIMIYIKDTFGNDVENPIYWTKTEESTEE